MINFDLHSELKKLITSFDAEKYPELYQYLISALNTEDTTPYQAANQILLCDRALDFPEAVINTITTLFKAAFDTGNADALNDLGAMYYDGSRGFEQNFAKAVEYYQISALNGSCHAQENLGYCYYYGRNMPIDYEKAFRCFAFGAFAGRLISLYKVGDMYANGYYVEKNEKEAFLIYQRCIDTMTDNDAKDVAGPVFLRLANCFLDGTGTKKNAENALVCYQKAEIFLYEMVRDGNFMYRESLSAAIDGQIRAREILSKDISDNS